MKIGETVTFPAPGVLANDDPLPDFLHLHFLSTMGSLVVHPNNMNDDGSFTLHAPEETQPGTYNLSYCMGFSPEIGSTCTSNQATIAVTVTAAPEPTTTTTTTSDPTDPSTPTTTPPTDGPSTPSLPGQAPSTGSNGDAPPTARGTGGSVTSTTGTLPRTGVESVGLARWGVLLAVSGVLVTLMLARRRAALARR